MRKTAFTFLTALMAFSLCSCSLLIPGVNNQETPNQTDKISVKSVTLDNNSISLTIGKTHKLNAAILPSDATNKNIIWRSASDAVAKVSNDGLVTGINTGEVTIFAMSEDNNQIKDSCIVKVIKESSTGIIDPIDPVIPDEPETIHVESVSLNKKNIILDVGQNETITATVLPNDAENKEITWLSQNSSIASVENGIIAAHKSGTTTIEVHTVDEDKTDTCVVTVNEPKIDPEPDDNDVNAYYANISSTATGNTLKVSLYNLIKDHTKYSYSNLEIAMRTTDRNWELSPDPDDENPYMNLLYMVDNTSTNKLHKWNTYHGSGGLLNNAVWDKEHIWAKSNGFPSQGADAYSDLHHLRASDMRNNNNRSNLPFGNCPNGTYVTDFNGDKSGKKGTTYEPIDRDKGDVARALFYMATRYYSGDGSSGTSLTLTNGTDSSGGKWGYLSTLLEWHRNDPPDEWEINRNGLVQKFQGNRNPFIDHPEYASRIWGN